MPNSTGARLHYRVRRLLNRLGGILSGLTNRGSLEPSRERPAHKLPGDTGGIFGCSDLRQKLARSINSIAIGQHSSGGLHQPPRGDSVGTSSQADQGVMDVVSPEGNQHQSATSARRSECGSRCRIKGHEGPIRLDAQPSDFSGDSITDGPSKNRPFCLPLDGPGPSILQLAPRSPSTNHGCVPSELDGDESLCQSPLELGGQSPGQSSERVSGSPVAGDTSLASPALVSCDSEIAVRLSKNNSAVSGLDCGSGTVQPAGEPPTSGCFACLKRRYETEKLSEGASNLLLASLTPKSSKSYDSMFQKWIGWCQEWNTDLVSGPISEVANFLVDLFDKGYQQRSINAYHSAISSAHDKVEGYSVGQHPTISRLMAGVANARPPQPLFFHVAKTDQSREDAKHLFLPFLSKE